MEQEYLIRSGSLQGYAELMTSLQGDTHALLKQVNLCIDDLKTHEKLISFNSMQKLLEISADQLHMPHLGLTLSQRQNIEMLGPLGLLMASCNTIKEAIHTVQRYMSAHSPAENWILSEIGNTASITRFEYATNTIPLKQVKELALGACYRMLTLFIGNQFNAIRLELSHSAISDIKIYRHIFKTDVKFNQDADRIIFDKKYLDYPVIFNSKERSQYLENYINLATQPFDNLERKIISLISQGIETNQSLLDSISTVLKMNKRTLQRHLTTQNISFKDLVAHVKGTKACWYLSASQMSITAISAALGYHDCSAFSKAFKKQHGCSPLQWRNNKQSTANKPNAR